MADKDDHLTYYRQFFENFAKTLNPNDQLPVKLASYKLVNTEIVGGIIDWTTQYLSQKKCPPNLCAPLIKIVIDEIRKACKKHPVNCGFNPADNAYEPLKLMQTVMAKTNEVCLRYLDNSMLCSLPSPESGNQYYLTSVYAIKNTRRRMEDRHVVIHDLNTMFNIQEDIPSSYYAIFDGHAGHDAAAYSSAHLHQFLAESDSFLTDPKQALSDAFCQTDALFINKCEVEHLSSGTTAVVALVRPKEKMLYIAWAGDSQATLVGRDRVVQLVNPHKPCRNDERERIEQQGGCVIKWGTWRVNGQLAVSRAIGDPDYKPFVIAVPDIQEIPLEGNDFLVLACDGLWDSLSEEAVAHMVYSCISKNPEIPNPIGARLHDRSELQCVRVKVTNAEFDASNPSVNRRSMASPENFDLVVLGGGSGGLSAAKEATSLGAKVCVLDFVKPSPRGTKWGLGGTCVNVGCIPKKLMHHAALLRDAVRDAKHYGWSVPDDVKLNWETLRMAINDHIKSVNWLVRVDLKDKGIEYVNGLGAFADANTIKADAKGTERILVGKYILIAVGGRPRYPRIPGAVEYGITSDDIFSLKTPPGKTLIVGAGYIAMETAGFLNGLGFKTTVMVRSKPLTEFDQDMVRQIKEDLQDRGVEFLNKCLPTKVEKIDDNNLKVFWENDKKDTFNDTFNTVLFAIGRVAATADLQLDKAGVKLAQDGDQIDAVNEQTNVSNIYAVGDVLYGKPQLTPVAILAGRYVARRLFAHSKQVMDYTTVPTTIFTPLEYGCVGLSEERAVRQFGPEQIEIYHGFYKPTEFFVPQRSYKNCYLKLITRREGDQYIVGMHFVGPNAGEVIQGYAAALRLCMSYKDLVDTVGIHPTIAEEFIRLTITKRSGKDPNPTACCN